MPYTMEKKVQPVEVRLYCNCGKEMERAGVVFYTYPMRYSYSCKCGETHTDTICYPTIEYREVK